VNGVDGNNGANGSSGTSGTSGSSGISGSSGSSGVSATIFNNADDRVITGSSTSGQLNGESGFTFDGTTAYINGALGVGTSTPTTTGLIRATNDVIAFYSSDERLKENKEIIQDPLNKLSSISGYEFDWIPRKGIHENEGRDVGVIAQEIERIFPQLVQTRDNGYKAVKYEKLVPVLIEAIKELKSEIDILKIENADIRNKINKL
jgi:hypothetical protein